MSALRHEIGDDEPIPLKVVAKEIFAGCVTIKKLRGEIAAGRLGCLVIGGQTFVTLRDLAEWQRDPTPIPEGEVVYFIKCNDRVKIGCTRDFEGRFLDLQNANAYSLEVLATVPGQFSLEAELHERFRQHRLHGEWFDLTDEIKDYIAEIKGDA